MIGYSLKQKIGDSDKKFSTSQKMKPSFSITSTYLSYYLLE